MKNFKNILNKNTLMIGVALGGYFYRLKNKFKGDKILQTEIYKEIVTALENDE